MDADVAIVQEALGRLILKQLTGAASTQYFPTGNPDSDEELQRRSKDTAEKLRELREHFENISTGILL